MIIEYVRYRLPPDQSREFKQAWANAQEPLRSSPHCFAYELSRCVEQPDRYILRIEWDSVEGHVEGFRTSPEFGLFVSHIRAYQANSRFSP